MPSISFLPFLQNVPFATRILTLTLVLFTLLAVLFRGLQSQEAIAANAISDAISNTIGSKTVDTIISHTGLSDKFGKITGEGMVSWGDVSYWLLVPRWSWRFPWTLFTSGWVEIHPLQFLLSIISLPLSARYLERVWGPRELFKFCAIVVMGSNVIAVGLSVLQWLVLGGEGLTDPIRGQSGLQVGFLVAFTQLIPEHQIQLFGKMKIRVKALPGLYLLFSNIICLYLGPQPYILIQFGFIVSWWYLRFFKLSENGEFRGDRSETFAFVMWFPPIARKPIGFVANFVHSLAVRFKVVQPWDGPGSYAMLPGPGSSRAEAERRRALALKALDARVASAPAPASGSTVPPATSSSTSAAVPATDPTPEKVKTPATESVPVYKEGGEEKKQ